MSAAVTDAVIGRCQELSREECEHFLEKGYVRIARAFPRSVAEEVTEQSWKSLAEEGIFEGQPETWKKMPYVRPAGFPDGRKILLREAAPRAMAAQADCVGGVDRLKMAPEGLSWGGGTVANLCKDADEPWQPPRPELAGWHKE